jgi:23S rRNA-/tRNA-specific pseudouridylate synthase
MSKRKADDAHGGAEKRKPQHQVCEVCNCKVNTNPKSLKIHFEGAKHLRRERENRERLENKPEAALAKSFPQPILVAEDDTLEILGEDEHFMCLNKPANLVTFACD